MKLFPLSVLFVCLGLAPVAQSQVPTSDTLAEGGEAVAPAPAEAVGLADCLASVHSTATADAAAARVAQLAASLDGQGGEETFWGRMHMAYADCYGSESLRRAMQPLLPPADTASNPDFREVLVLLHDIWQTLEDIRTSIDSAQDNATADTAAEAISLFSSHIDDCLKSGASLPPPKGNRIDLVIYYFSGEYRRTAAIYKAWGELQNRSGNYYESDALSAAMEKLFAALENLDLSADPYAVGRMILVCGQMEELMCRWLDIACSVCDRESADAAAPQLRACAESLGDISRALGQGYEKDLGRVSPRFLFLSLSCDRLAQLFARRNYFDSKALSEVMSLF